MSATRGRRAREFRTIPRRRANDLTVKLTVQGKLLVSEGLVRGIHCGFGTGYSVRWWTDSLWMVPTICPVCNHEGKSHLLDMKSRVACTECTRKSKRRGPQKEHQYFAIDPHPIASLSDPEPERGALPPRF